MPRLIAPTTRLYASWLVAHREWGPGLHEDGFGLRASDEVETPQGFADWVHRLHQAPDTSVALDARRAPSRHWWIVDDSDTEEGCVVLGAIALRPQLNDFLLRAGGQVGYGVTPSARGRGIATWAVGKVLVKAGELGLARRYWISLTD